MISATTAFIIAALKLMLAGVAAYFVIEFLARQCGMNENLKIACQIAVFIIVILAILSDADSIFNSTTVPPRPLSPSNPSIIR